MNNIVDNYFEITDVMKSYEFKTIILTIDGVVKCGQIYGDGMLIYYKDIFTTTDIQRKIIDGNNINKWSIEILEETDLLDDGNTVQISDYIKAKYPEYLI